MIATSPFYNIDYVHPIAAQQLKAAFTSDQYETPYLSYNSISQSFRARYGDAHCLFFFKTDFFQKTLFRNEYGVIVGKVAPDQIHTGSVHLDKKQFRFLISGEEVNLSIIDTRTNDVLLKMELSDELLAANLDEQNKQDLIHCVIFSLAWMLKKKG